MITTPNPKIINAQDACCIEQVPLIDINMICATWQYTMLVDYGDDPTRRFMQARLHNMLHGLLVLTNGLGEEAQEEITFLKDLVPFNYCWFLKANKRVIRIST